MRARLLLVMVLAVATSEVWAEIAVTAHVHTKFSDGTGTVEGVVGEASRSGGQAVIISDHAEMVNERYKYFDAYPEDPGSKQRILLSSDSTVEDWIEATGKNHSLPLVCGMEVGIGPKFVSHLLFWGANPEDYRTIVYLTGKSQSEPERVLRDLISYAAQKNAALVQAHPLSLFNPFKYEMEPVAGSVFGVEFFNAIATEAEQKLTFKRLLRVQSKCDFPVIATGGSDWHGASKDIPVDVISQLCEAAKSLNLMAKAMELILSVRGETSMYRPSLLRRTIVLTEQNSPQAIMSALRAGRCYACFEPTGNANRIVAASAMPGEKFQPTDKSPLFWMKIRGLGANDEVTVGLVDRKGNMRKGTLSGKYKIENGVGAFAFNLRDICSPNKGNHGWWLFIMTPRVVTSAIEILPWPEERQEVRELPQTPETKVVSQPSPPAQKPSQSDDPMAGCSEVWYGKSLLEQEGEVVKAWVGSIPGTDSRRLCLKWKGSTVLLVTMARTPSCRPRCHLWVAKFNPINLGNNQNSQAQLSYDVSLDGDPSPLSLQLLGGVLFPFEELKRIR